MDVYTPAELRAKIASNEYGAEHCLQHAMANIEALEMALEALRKDADRYRWLRDNACTQQADSLGPIFRIDVRITGKWYLGSAIDAAIAATPAVGAA